MKIYISGMISKNKDYEKQFKEAENKLKASGYVVLNPVKNIGFSYKDYIDMSLAELSKCDVIFMMKNWQFSSGACLERMYAMTVGLKIFYE